MPANPKAVQIRISGATASQVGGQRAHDLRIGAQPDYVATERSHLNRVLVGNATGSELRTLCEKRRELREEKVQRAMKSNAAVGFSGIITFGHTAHGYFEGLTADQQDAAYRKVAEAVAKRLETSLHGLVVHLDETSNHAHFQLAGVTFSGDPVSQIAKRQALRDLQTIAAEVMQKFDRRIERGTSRMKRLAEGEDYADTVHKSGAEMRAKMSEDLPALNSELDSKSREITLLNADILTRTKEIKAALAKAQKNEDRADKARQKAAADDDRAVKALRNAELYDGRAKNAREVVANAKDALSSLEEKLAQMRSEKELLDEELDRVNAEIGDSFKKLDDLQTATAQKKTSIDSLRMRKATLLAKLQSLNVA